MENVLKPQRSKVSIWIQASRPFAFTASVTSVLVAAATVFLIQPKPHVDWFLFPVIFFGAVLFHTSANLIGEYFDYMKSVDRSDTYGSSRVLIDSLLTPKEVLFAGYLTLTVGFLLGMILVYYRGTNILALGIAGALACVFYTAKPIRFKYIALGDFLIFVMFGPLLVIGAYLGLTGSFNWNVFWISIPIVLPVVGILHANNTRDIISDTRADIKTLASVIGLKAAKIEYYILIIGAYTGVVLLVAFGVFKLYALVSLITLPGAIKNIKEMANASIEKPEDIAMLDVKTAQHHTQFGLLYIVGILLTAFL